MTDLLKSVKQETDIDISILKINIMAFSGVIFSIGFAFFLNRIYQSAGDLVYNIFITLTLGTVFLVVVFLQSILIKDTKRVGAILFIQSAVMLIPFAFLLSGFIIVGLIINYLFLYWGSSSAKKELQYSMKVRIFRISKFILPKAITGLSIFVAASYMSIFQETGLLISFDTFKRIILPSEAITKIMITDFSLDDSFSNTIVKSIPNPGEIPQDQLTKVISEQQATYSRILNYNFEVNDTLVNILYNAYKQNMENISPNNKIYILVVLGIIIFLLVRSVGTPISWFVALVAALVYEILIALGFANIVLETRSREIILLK